MKTLIFKSSISLLGAGGVAGGGLLISKYLNWKNVETRLKEDKYELLTNDQTNDDKWAEILKNYKTVTQKHNNLAFSGFIGDEDDAKSMLQKHCKVALISYDENDYKKAAKWCVVPVSATDLLEKRGFKALKTGSDSSADNERWTDKVKKHKSESNEALKFDGITLTSGKDQAIEQDLQNLKAKCDGIKDKKSHEEGFDDFVKQYEAWCSYK
ncbi:hypothetical protein A6V39_03715 [Candidatus Mycoplasma haematobovis]|uniref:Uncharacterized protein n=1 Tax=Candidatus Mycoplasma haematobovis TaxID=432608 RepID=A0A1A9QD23_9MOLU|nr:hypothetical protein [Candidatus Mycoplasma haematobovis]OAL09994.1 hypothetical protein A6V39_03715 [Candidatus Mycoplasma haematobovis]